MYEAMVLPFHALSFMVFSIVRGIHVASVSSSRGPFQWVSFFKANLWANLVVFRDLSQYRIYFMLFVLEEASLGF